MYYYISQCSLKIVEFLFPARKNVMISSEKHRVPVPHHINSQGPRAEEEVVVTLMDKWQKGELNGCATVAGGK